MQIFKKIQRIVKIAQCIGDAYNFLIERLEKEGIITAETQPLKTNENVQEKQ